MYHLKSRIVESDDDERLGSLIARKMSELPPSRKGLKAKGQTKGEAAAAREMHVLSAFGPVPSARRICADRNVESLQGGFVPLTPNPAFCYHLGKSRSHVTDPARRSKQCT
jgi:hypothetical protein